MRRILIPALTIAVLILIGVGCYGRPPAGADPNSDLGRWFQSLTQPGTGIGCCSNADCRPVEYRIRGDHYEALIDKQFIGVDAPTWTSVPNDHILKNKDNPTGRAIACYLPGVGILCFVLPAQV